MEGLCVLCKEPITNPLTIETLGFHIEQWLPRPLSGQFRRLHHVLANSVSSPLRGMVAEEQVVCTHCYVKEVYQWLRRADGTLAELFLGMFSFGYPRSSFAAASDHLAAEMPIEEREFGICDECGEYSETLTIAGGEWLCPDCDWR